MHNQSSNQSKQANGSNLYSQSMERRLTTGSIKSQRVARNELTSIASTESLTRRFGPGQNDLDEIISQEDGKSSSLSRYDLQGAGPELGISVNAMGLTRGVSIDMRGDPNTVAGPETPSQISQLGGGALDSFTLA